MINKRHSSGSSGGNCMKKRLLAIVLALVMLSFPGCNRKKDKEASLPYDDLISETLPPVELEIYIPGTIPNYSKDLVQAMMDNIAVITKDTINVSPRLNWFGYDIYDTVISMAIASDDNIDAFTCFSPNTYVAQGFCIDLTAMLKQAAPNYYHELMSNEMGKDYLTSCTVDGKLYAIPYNGVENPRICVVAKADMAAKYAPNGMETLEDYGEFIKKIKENEADILPGIVHALEFFQAYMEGNGYYSRIDDLLYSKWEKSSDIFYPIEQTPEFSDAFELIKLWKKQGYILNSDLLASGYHITNNQLASVLYPMNDLGYLFTYAQPYSNAQFKIFPLYTQSRHLINSDAGGMAVTRRSRNPERVVMFLEWLHASQENYDSFMHGQEGVHYTLLDGDIVIPADISNPLLFWKEYGTVFFKDYRYERFTRSVGADFRKTYLDSSLTNVMTSFELKAQLLKETDKEDMERLETASPEISAIMNTYHDNFHKFITTIDRGLFNMTLDELIEKQKEAGIDKAMEFYRKTMGW